MSQNTKTKARGSEDKIEDINMIPRRQEKLLDS